MSESASVSAVSAANAIRVVLAAVALAALLVGIATARALAEGAQAVKDSDAAVARGDLATATMRARDAAEAVAPGSPYPREGYERLEAIAHVAEARLDERGATAAWGAMRAAATATAGPLIRTDTWRALADDGLVRAGTGFATPGAVTGEVHASEATLRTALGREDAPSAWLLTLLGAGALGFFAGCARLALAAKDLATLRHEKLALAAVAVGMSLYALVSLRG
ncbi:MAG: hypothetical protein ACLQVI_13195 [Polyangiaceae bacterium]